VARQVQVVFKPGSPFKFERFQATLALGRYQVVNAVFSVHQLVDLALVVLLQRRKTVFDDFEEAVVKNLEFIGQSLLERLLKKRATGFAVVHWGRLRPFWRFFVEESAIFQLLARSPLGFSRYRDLEMLQLLIHFHFLIKRQSLIW